MCGIAGFLGPYDRDRLHAMTEAMHHRGPDQTGLLLLPGDAPNHRAGLGHKRLSIIDLTSGSQPMANEDGELHVVFNGEIYNFRSLRPELIRAGHRFATHCDTEVLLHGYEEYKEGLVDRLEGMFAFGIWDARAQEWFLARDRFGIKPLYYCEPEPGRFAFASEIKPLLPLVGGARMNLEALYHYLLYGWSSTEETLFQNIFQLRPGHWLRYEHGRLEKRRYWRVELSEEEHTEQAWADILREQLSEAVKCHLLADVPVGITLSGGLDSSAVLAMMARAVDPGRIQAFTVGYGLPSDETPYAELAAKHFGVAAGNRTVALERVADVFDRILWHLEEPIAHPVLGTTYFLAEYVREQVKVVLIGEGSDELFAGYPHFRLFRPPYSWAPGWLRRRVLPAAAFVMPNADTLANFLHPDLLDRELLAAVSHVYDDYQRRDNPAQGWLQCELENELVYAQLARIDKLTMAHSVEARVPFLDRRFAETACRVPFALKHRGGVEKHILRQALRDRLPAAVLHRPKTGPKGTQNLLPALLERVLRERIADLTSPAAIRRRGWFQAEQLASYFSRANAWWVQRHPIDRLRRTKFLWALAVVEQWARLFLDCQTSALGLPRAA